MGYRSDVSLTIEQSDFNKLLEQVENANENIKWFFNLASKFVSEEYITLYWEWVKWYEGFEEVEFFEKFYQKLDHYKFIRLGEDVGDNYEDYRGDYIDCASMERSICCDGKEFDCKVICE